MAPKPRTLKKPSLSDIDSFAVKSKASAPKSQAQTPEGDVRLVVNFRKDAHRKLKMKAAERGTTMGELLEELVDKL